jgi:ankyrin repeat protein
VKALAWLGAEVNARHKNGVTPCFIAAESGHLEIMQALASLGGDVNVPRNKGATPRFVATQHGHMEVVKTWLVCCARM